MEDASGQSLRQWTGDVMEVSVLNRADAAWMGAAPRAGGAPAVRLGGGGRRYGRGRSEVRALDGVSLEIGDGAFVAVMGPSGSGKSTLLNLIGALDRPTEGRIVVGDRDVATLSAKEAARYRRRQMGFIFQSFNLLPRLTVLENVALPLMFEGIAPAERARLRLSRASPTISKKRMAMLPSRRPRGRYGRRACARRARLRRLPRGCG